MSNASDEEILARRARELAKPIKTHSDQENANLPSYLVFRLGPESYAVDANYVLDVVATERITPLPSLPPYIVGVLPVRGLIWSVMDLRAFFKIPRQGISDYPRAVLVKAGQLRFGILTDSKLDIVHPTSLRPPPEITEKIPRNVIRGTLDDLTVVLDLDTLAQDPRMIISDEPDS